MNAENMTITDERIEAIIKHCNRYFVGVDYLETLALVSRLRLAEKKVELYRAALQSITEDSVSSGLMCFIAEMLPQKLPESNSIALKSKDAVDIRIGLVNLILSATDEQIAGEIPETKKEER